MSDESAKRTWRLRTWFIVGFVLTFVAMIVLVNQYVHMDAGLARCKLWQFYLTEIGRSFKPRNLGPASGSASRALYVFAIHVLASCVGGLVALGVGALRRRFKDVD